MSILKRYKYKINNLDCANCARMIEDKLNDDQRLQDVSINFSRATISFKAEDDSDILKYLNDKVSQIEDGIIISNEELKRKNTNLINLIIGLVLIILSYLISNSIIKELLIIASYIILLYKTLFTALKSLRHGIMNENFLITISCIGAYLVDQKMEGLMVIILYTIGKILEEKAIYNSRKGISDLMDIRVDKANLKTKNKII